MRFVYLVRHCKAIGQAPDDPLTPEGEAQAVALGEFLAGRNVDRIVCSPYLRAIQSAQPLAERQGIAVETDDRLVERVLCAGGNPEWLRMLAESFNDPDLCYEGGESGRTAADRGAAVLAEVRAHPTARATAIVTHGNLLALMLQTLDPAFGFEQWQMMTNPDVFRVSFPSGRWERVWHLARYGGPS